MHELTTLETLTGLNPYRWQSRLFLLFLQGNIPNALDVPTGLGKTSVMGIWLASRALGSPVPRRLVYVVDRRAVADQATTEAERLAVNLAAMLDGGVGPDVAKVWRSKLGLQPGEKLPISTLRGQYADNRLWLENPARSAIVVGTVDMIGSRMLFEGYGVSPRSRSVHAALIANDTLVVLDEAHLVPPFHELVREVGRFRRPAPVPEMRFMALSATGSAGNNESVFRIQPGDESEETPIKSRLEAPKRLLVRDTEDLALSLADRAFELGQGGRRVLIFCNSRDKLARIVAEDLRERCAKKWKGAPTTVLLVGGRRVGERESLTARRTPSNDSWEVPPDPLFSRFLSGGAPDPNGIPTFLVATSAGEVGVDLDADHMVCDLVAWERMVQRLGRVNRSGRAEPAFVDVFAAIPDDDVEDDLRERLEILRVPFESPLWAVGQDGRRQAGPGALRDLRQNQEFAALAAEATTPEPLRPKLTEPLVEAWAMTSLDNHPGRPKVDPWLRGWVKQPPQSKIAWRSVLPLREGEGPNVRLLSEFFEVLSPHLTEVLEAEAYRVAEVLKARAGAVMKAARKADVEDRYRSLEVLAAVLLDSRGVLETPLLSLETLKDIEPEDLAGKTIVVDARIGGLSPDGLLDRNAADPPSTLDGQGGPLWDEARLRAIGRRLRIVPRGTHPLDGWVREDGWPTAIQEDNDAPEEWRVERVVQALTEGDSTRLLKAQALNEHLAWAVEEADRIASALDLSAEFQQMLRTSAALHDSGKDREIWQTAMGAPRSGRPFAKTDGRRADGRALGGYRHEFGSLRDAGPPVAAIEDEGLRELALHLIASHHGFARPVISAVDPADPPTLLADRVLDVALRFAKLQKQWGPWGLAWWESVLRAVDWAASARSVEQKTQGENR